MTSGPSRPAPPPPEVVAQALALVLKAMEDSEPAGDGDDQDIESKMNHLNRLAWRRQVAVEALQLAGQTEAALFRRRRNALLSIHRLPLELLSAILINSIRANQPQRMKALQLLSQVVWQWWQTIKSNPQFWTYITPPIESAKLQIRKAGILPLRLNWPTDVYGVKDLLQRHAERWTSMVLQGYPKDVVLQVLCTSTFPRLEHLEVRRTFAITSRAWRFNVAEFQSLREAHFPIVPYFSVSPTSNNPRLLQTLYLNLALDGSHSSYDLESVLRYNPQLIELEVDDLTDETHPPSPVNTPIINLPMLRHLRFSDVVSGGERDEIPLLAQIRAPLDAAACVIEPIMTCSSSTRDWDTSFKSERVRTPSHSPAAVWDKIKENWKKGIFWMDDPRQVVKGAEVVFTHVKCSASGSCEEFSYKDTKVFQCGPSQTGKQVVYFSQ